MLESTTGDLQLGSRTRLGPGTRVEEMQSLAVAVGAEKRPCRLWPYLADEDEWRWTDRLDGEAGEFLVTTRFLNGWLRDIEVVCAAPARERGAGKAEHLADPERLQERHRRLLRRWGVRTPNTVYPWGQVQHCHADPWPGEETPAKDPSDLIRIDYTAVPPEPIRRPGREFLGYSVWCALAGFAALAWATWFRARPLEALSAFDWPWISGLALLTAAALLLLTYDWLATGAPGSREELWRWPCPGCRGVGGYSAQPGEPVPALPGDFRDLRRCTLCGAVFSQDSLAQHPRLQADTPPGGEAHRRWPLLEGPSRLPERFRRAEVGEPGPLDGETELRALISALEAGLQQAAAPGTAILTCLLLPALALLLRRGTPAPWPPLILATVILAVAGTAYLRALDERVRRRRLRLGYLPQIDAYLSRTGLGREEFRRHAAEAAGPSSLLARGLAEADRRR